MRKLNVYQCKFCRKKASESTMIYHERACYKNPLVHACLTCFWMEELYSGNFKCFLEKEPSTLQGKPARLRRRCKQWINKDQSWNLDMYFNSKKERAL
jgi:hypothetical protein